MSKNEFLKRLKEDLSSLTDDERTDALKYYEEYFADAEENNDADENITEFESPDDLTDKLQEVADKNNEPSGIQLVLEDSVLLDETIKKIDEEEKRQEIVIEIKKEEKEENNQQNHEQKQNQNQYNNVNNNFKTEKLNKSNDNAWKVILLVCTIPFWLPILIGLGSAAFGIFMALLGVAFAVAAIAASGFIMVGAGFMSVGYGVFNIFTNISNAFYPIGSGFVAIGIGIVIAYSFSKLTAVMFKSQFKFASWAIKGISGKFSRRGA